MKYLGIDYGTKRIGLAVSDDEGKMAFPREVAENTPGAPERIASLVRDEGIEKIVIGESRDLSGKDNPVMEGITALKEALEKAAGVPVVLEPEFYTTVEAARIQGRTDTIDASAAALILQHYIDKQI